MAWERPRCGDRRLHVLVCREGERINHKRLFRVYHGGYTILSDWLRPQRKSALTAAVARVETPPGKQAQVDRGHLGSIEMEMPNTNCGDSRSRSATAGR